MAFEKGEKGKVDFESALVAYRKAAELGHREAQYALGSLMERAKSTQNIAEIAAWFRKAADQEHPEAEFRTAQAFEIGLGVKRSVTEAVDWYERSFSHGKIEANLRLPPLWLEAANLELEPKKQLQLMRKAAEAGHAPAQVRFAHMLVTQADSDPAEMVKWIRTAAEAGDTECQVKLALAYKNGSFTKPNLGETEKWLKAAANQRFRYPTQPAFGEVSPIFEQIIEFCFSLANRGHCEAMYWLGICYNDGLGVPVDIKQAAKWFHKSSQAGYAKADEDLAKIPPHVVESVARGRPKWDHRSTVLPFNLSEDNKKLIDTAKKLSTRESFVARIDLYECFLGCRLLVPFTDEEGQQFHFVPNPDGGKGAVAFSDFASMTEWRSANAGGSAWLEKDAFECSSMLAQSESPLLVLNPSPANKGVLLRQWELEAFSRRVPPVPRGEYINVIHLDDKSKMFARIPERPTDAIRQVIGGILSSDRNIENAFLVESAFEPLIERPVYTIVVILTKSNASLARDSLRMQLRKALNTHREWNDLRILTLADATELQSVRRKSHCVYERSKFD